MIPFQLDKKTLIMHQFIVIMSLFSICFSIYYLTQSNNIFSYFAYEVITTKQSHVINYTICSILYIIVLIIASSSYLGLPVISFSITYRFLMLAYSLQQINNCTIMRFLVFIIPQIIIELLITYIMTYMSLQLTLQTVKLSFIQKGNYNLKYLLNYILNYILVAIFLIFLSCLIKIYLL